MRASVGQRVEVVLVKKKAPGIGDKEIVTGKVDAVTDEAFIIDGTTYLRVVWLVERWKINP